MIQTILTPFLDAYQLHPVAQILGLVGIVVVIGGFQLKTAKQILLIQSFGSFLWMIHFILLGAHTGAFLNLLVIPRNIIYSFRGKKSWADSYGWPILFSFLVLCVTAYSHFYLGEGWTCLLSLCAEICGAIAFFNKNAQKIRGLIIGSSAFWLLYNFFAGSIPGVIAEILKQISLYVGLFRYRKQKGV